MKNENKTQSSPRCWRQHPLSMGAPGGPSEGERRQHGHPHAVGQEGWGDTGTAFGGGAAALPIPAHLVAGSVDRGRGTLAQEVLGAPQVVWGALHLQRCRCWGGKHTGHPGGLCQPRHQTPAFIRPRLAMPGVKKPAQDIPLGAAGLLPRQRRAGSTGRRAAHGRGCRRCQKPPCHRELSGPAAEHWQMQKIKKQRHQKKPTKNTNQNKRANKRRAARWREAPPHRENRNRRDCKTRSASISCGWRRKCFSFLLEKKNSQSCNCPRERWTPQPGPGRTLGTANGAEHGPEWGREMGGKGRSGSAARVCVQPSLPCWALHTCGANTQVLHLKKKSTAKENMH